MRDQVLCERGWIIVFNYCVCAVSPCNVSLADNQESDKNTTFSISRDDSHPGSDSWNSSICSNYCFAWNLYLHFGGNHNLQGEKKNLRTVIQWHEWVKSHKSLPSTIANAATLSTRILSAFDGKYCQGQLTDYYYFSVFPSPGCRFCFCEFCGWDPTAPRDYSSA